MIAVSARIKCVKTLEYAGICPTLSLSPLKLVVRAGNSVCVGCNCTAGLVSVVRRCHESWPKQGASGSRLNVFVCFASEKTQYVLL